MSESFPFVDVLADTLWHASQCRGQWSQDDCRAALHALIAHCRADRTGKQDLPVAAPASASARAEAMRRLEAALDNLAVHGSVANNVWHDVADAARVVLALPEPDPCAGLRGLLAWGMDQVAGDVRHDAGLQPEAMVDGMHQMRDHFTREIRRRIAAGGGQ